jgi:hypothetical protein
MNGIINWFNSNPEQTRRILDDANISDGPWNQGFCVEWPAFYHCFAKSKVGCWFASTYDDLVACLERAHHAVDEQPSDPISNIHDVVGDDHGTSSSLARNGQRLFLTGGPARTVGTYSNSWVRPSKVRLLIISRPTSG